MPRLSPVRRVTTWTPVWPSAWTRPQCVYTRTLPGTPSVLHVSLKHLCNKMSSDQQLVDTVSPMNFDQTHCIQSQATAHKCFSNRSKYVCNWEKSISSIHLSICLSIHPCNLCSSRALFEKEKLVFSFMLCGEILKTAKFISVAGWNFFLRGAAGLDRVSLHTSHSLQLHCHGQGHNSCAMLWHFLCWFMFQIFPDDDPWFVKAAQSRSKLFNVVQSHS